LLEKGKGNYDKVSYTIRKVVRNERNNADEEFFFDQRKCW